MSWQDSISNSVSMSLRKFWVIVEDRGAWRATVRGFARVGHDLATEQQQHYAPKKFLMHIYS